jgi:hypothetical protein
MFLIEKVRRDAAGHVTHVAWFSRDAMGHQTMTVETEVIDVVDEILCGDEVRCSVDGHHGGRVRIVPACGGFKTIADLGGGLSDENGLADVPTF